jgi:hypothetical protein
MHFFVVVARARLVGSARLLVLRILVALIQRVIGTFAVLGTGLEALVVAFVGTLAAVMLVIRDSTAVTHCCMIASIIVTTMMIAVIALRIVA